MAKKNQSVSETHEKSDLETIAQACVRLGVSETTLLALIERGDVAVERDEDGEVTGVCA